MNRAALGPLLRPSHPFQVHQGSNVVEPLEKLKKRKGPKHSPHHTAGLMRRQAIEDTRCELCDDDDTRHGEAMSHLPLLLRPGNSGAASLLLDASQA